MSERTKRVLAWLFDEKPSAPSAPPPNLKNAGSDQEETGGRAPRWYERGQLGEGNLDEDGKLKLPNW